MEHKVGLRRWFDWLLTIVGGWLTAGIFLDGWAHLHRSLAQETFFTPWHGALYGGFLAAAVVLIIAWAVNIQRGFTWRQALPHHYRWSLAGVVLFALAGLGDLGWHTLFGVEASVESLLSPTHLALAFGAALIVSGPLRELLQREEQAERGLLADIPAVLSLTYTLSVIGFMTQYLHPFGIPWSARETADLFFGQVIGLGQVLLFTVLLVGLTLALLHRRDLPFGSFTVTLGLHAVAMSVLHDTPQFIVAALIAGLLIDMLVFHAGRRLHYTRVVRLFSVAVPVLFFILYFTAVELSEGIRWSTHLWTGAIAISGITGWLLSFLVVPAYRTHHSRQQ